MAKQKEHATLKDLFDYQTMAMEDLIRSYRFFDFNGEERIKSLGDSDKLSEKLRCPRDGVRLIIYSGEPHNTIECPNCQYHISQNIDYSKEKDISNIERKISKTELELRELNAMKQVISNPNHPIIKANLSDKAMNNNP